MEQSRSNRETVLPCVSAKTWISIWRGRVEVFLDQYVVIAERGAGFTLGAVQCSLQLGSALYDAHALAAAAGRGLDQHGVTDAFCGRGKRGHILRIAVIARNKRNA